MTGWRPIETAPKDGSKIDLWTVWGEGVAPGRIPDCRWMKPKREPEECWCHHLGGRWTPLISTPTHWMAAPFSPVTDTNAP